MTMNKLSIIDGLIMLILFYPTEQKKERNKILNLWSQFIDWGVLEFYDLPKVTKNKHFWLVNRQPNDYQFWTAQIIKMSSLKIYLSPVMEKLEILNLDSR